MRGLQGKVALVAGAASGNIGAATAIRLAEEIQALGGKAIARSFDITDEAS
jgi:NAD(P)-dependent dehydrogenase (short-subunit alcohol dehydrogenase family)